MLHSFLICATAIGISTTCVWLVSLAMRDASIADLYWGLGFVLFQAVAIAAGPAQNPERAWLALVLVAFWGLRLSLYLSFRNLGQGEDRRYQAMRRHWGNKFPLVSLVSVFWLQGALLCIVALPLLATAHGAAPLGLFDAVGGALVIFGVVYEGTADLQLARFRADAKNVGAVMDRGLWRTSRHPNYFAEAVVWWGFYGLALGAGAPWAIVGPLLMTTLLLKVSGVSLLERTIVERRPAYAAYIEATSAFVPWPRRAPHASSSNTPSSRT